MLIMFFYSCAKENIIDNQSDRINSSMLKSATTEELDWTGIPLNIYPIKGLTTSKKYLSTNSDGSHVHLWNNDDGSGRQKWILIKNSDGYYNIKAYSGVSSSRLFLSSARDGSDMGLWNVDDLSGRQQWSLVPLGNDLFNIKIKGGISNSRKFLSTDPDGDRTDLWSSDDDSGRQQWKIEEVGDFELVGISYYLTPEDVNVTLPSYIATTTVVNNSPVTQTQMAHFSNKASETSSFTKTLGISIRVSSSLRTAVPVLVENTLVVETQSSYLWSYSSTESKEDTRSYDFPVVVPPFSAVRTNAIIGLRRVSAGYEATFRSKITQKIKKVQGKWTGILPDEISYIITDLNTGSTLTLQSKDINGPVVLN